MIESIGEDDLLMVLDVFECGGHEEEQLLKTLVFSYVAWDAS